MKKFLIVLLLASFAASAAKASSESAADTTKKTAEQILTISKAVKDYKKKHSVLPGDTNKDGKIGNGHISKYVTAQTGIGPQDETVIFWDQLRNDGYLENFEFVKKGSAEYPLTAIKDVYFMIGYFDGSQETANFTNRPLRGNALIFMGGKNFSKDGLPLPLTKKTASDLDEDLDDGNPAYRLVRTYGCVIWTQKSVVRGIAPRNPEAPKYKYSPYDNDNNCGLIAVISE